MSNLITVLDADLVARHPVMTDLFAGLTKLANFGLFRPTGNLFIQAGNPIGQNAADTTDDIIAGILLDAAALQAAGQGLFVSASGVTGATTNNKQFKLFLNPTMTGQTVSAGGIITGGHVTAGTPLVTSGSWVNATTPNNAAGWALTAQLTKYGALGSNTQIGQGSPILGTLHGGVQAPQALTITESGTIAIVVTGASQTTGAAGDVQCMMFSVAGED